MIQLILLDDYYRSGDTVRGVLFVSNAAGAGVTGRAGSITSALHTSPPSGGAFAASAASVTIAEIGVTGYYNVSYPAATSGPWILTLVDPLYGVWRSTLYVRGKYVKRLVENGDYNGDGTIASWDDIEADDAAFSVNARTVPAALTYLANKTINSVVFTFPART